MRTTRTRPHAMAAVRRTVTLACIAVGVVVVAAPGAEAGLHVVFGDVYCHAAAAGPPRYFHSNVAGAAAANGPHDAWSSLDDAARRRLERRTLDGLAVEFARHVTERHAVDALLDARCDLTPLDAAAAAIAAATYVRAGAAVSPLPAEKVEVGWKPDFKTALEQHARAIAAPSAGQ